MTLGTAPSVLDPSFYIPELTTDRKEAALAELVSRAHQAGAVRGPEPLLELLVMRERLGSTAIGKGVALPHARSLTVNRPQLVVARSRRGIDWDAPDELPVTLILLILTPGEWGEEAHHALLGRAAWVARLQRNRQRLLDAANFDEVASVFREVGP
jgi:mannitol/fructose-specific phosphotransferase system IIA component (Ntr-type)